jgi:hypothetical protein
VRGVLRVGDGAEGERAAVAERVQTRDLVLQLCTIIDRLDARELVGDGLDARALDRRGVHAARVERPEFARARVG